MSHPDDERGNASRQGFPNMGDFARGPSQTSTLPFVKGGPGLTGDLGAGKEGRGPDRQRSHAAGNGLLGRAGQATRDGGDVSSPYH